MRWFWILTSSLLYTVGVSPPTHAAPFCKQHCHTTCQKTPHTSTEKASLSPRSLCLQQCRRACRRERRRCVRCCAYRYLLTLRRCNRYSMDGQRQQCQKQALHHQHRCEQSCSHQPSHPTQMSTCLLHCKHQYNTSRRRCFQQVKSKDQRRCYTVIRTVYHRCSRSCRKP